MQRDWTIIVAWYGGWPTGIQTIVHDVTKHQCLQMIEDGRKNPSKRFSATGYGPDGEVLRTRD